MTKRPIPKNDQQSFAEAMRDVRPLAPGAARVPNPPPDPDPRRITARRSAIMEAVGAATDPPRTERAGDAVKVWADGVDRERVKALGRGDYPPEATLDLHGARTPDVAARINAFVRAAQAAHRRVIIIVTGRGLGSGPAGPVVREAAIDTLTRACGKNAPVLAFVTAPAAHGGAGALLVLLRR